MDDYDECCGLAGSFTIKNRKLKQGLKLIKNKNTKVISLLEFLSKAEIENLK